MKIRPAWPGQPDIEHEASWVVRAVAAQEFVNRGKQLDSQADRLEKTAKCLAYLLIVVDDDDRGLSLVMRRCPPSPWRRSEWGRCCPRAGGCQGNPFSWCCGDLDCEHIAAPVDGFDD